MEISAIRGTSAVTGTAVPDVQTDGNQNAVKVETMSVDSVVGREQTSVQKDSDQNDTKDFPLEEKEPTVSTIDSAVSNANSKLSKTRCEYSYDEATRRVSIKVYDKDSDELIREVPPEKSLEMLQKMWELAGIMVDEKR